jgi:hypothetical protein
MRQRSAISSGLAILAILSASATVHAGNLVVSNLDQGAQDSVQVLPYFSQFSVVPGETVAQQFQTGPTQTTTLDGVFVSLGYLDPGTNGTFDITARLVADQNNLPTGSVLTTFTHTGVLTSGFGVVRFDPTSAVTLQPGTKYWVILGGTYTNPTAFDDWGSVSIQYTYSTGHTGPGEFGFYNDSYNGGSSWNLNPTLGEGLNEPFLMSINVPEPSSLVLGTIGLSCILLVSPKRWSR